jgi:tetratricopeptide (TPR) repeat protein
LSSAQVSKSNPEQKLQQHYDAARTFQISGDNQHASAEYSTFLSLALQQCARARAVSGDLVEAAALFDQALKLTPSDNDLLLSFAYLRLQQQQLNEAAKLAQTSLSKDPKDPTALALAGNIAFMNGNYADAREKLETAVVAKSNFETGYLLGKTYVRLNDFQRAQILFGDMARGLGDTARIHIYFGRAYADGDIEGLDLAVKEFKKAISLDPKVRQAHYFLALAYLNRDGESGFAEAAPELKAELALNPKDARARYLLGYIHMKRRQLVDAETELRKAAELDPGNPDPLVFLGQLYSDSNRDKEAEVTLRKAIQLTTDVSRNDYQINRAHYVLGRVLLRAGHTEEGTKELALSKELRDQVRNPGKADKQEFSSLNGSNEPATEAETVSPEARKKADDFIAHLRPAIADAYNNLGVIHAGQKQFVEAYASFIRAREWQPSLETLDRNLGMAAFYGNKYEDAIEPLYQHLSLHPDDLRARAALALSYFMTQKFSAVLEIMKPEQSAVEHDPGLAYAYAVSLVKTGNYNDGVKRLKALETSSENSAEIHALLGQAYADQNDYVAAAEEYKKSLAINANQPETHYLLGLAVLKSGSPAEAVEEFRTALKQAPNDASKKYHLAFALIQVQQKEEARKLLDEVIKQDPRYADAFYELGKLQLEQGEVKPAIANFETGSQLSPNSDYMHYQLAMAYRRDSRAEDAEREIKIYQALKNRARGRDVPQAN